MPIYLKTSVATNSWRKATSLYLKTSAATNSWRKIVSAYIKTNDGWRSLFSSIVFPSIENQVSISSSGGINAGSTIMSDSSSITLTATRYHWNDADGFTYIWQKSSNNLTWSDIGSAQATTNPAAGSSSSSITKVLSSSDFTSGSDMYFRFKFIATNSTYSTSSSSESSSLLISYYGTPTPAPGSPSITGSTTVGNIAYGNIGTWTNSPTSYDYRWFFNAGLSSYPLTFSQARSVSNKYLSGFSAALVTSANHGYKANDTVLVSGMDSLFNGLHVITLKTNNTIYFTLPTPTAWANAGTGYSSGTFVSYIGNVYAAASIISSASLYSSVTTYASGAIVYSGNNRYQSNLSSNTNHPVTDVIWWNNLGSYAPGGSQWTLQSFSNAAASGTTTAPNYYEGTASSSTSIALTTPTTDYKASIDLRDQVLGFGVKAYNQATTSPSEYTANAFIYGIPVITIGTIVPGSTSASIPFTQAYMTSYDIDIKYLGVSVSGYPATVSSPSSPISVTGLLAPRTYAYTITPKNGEGASGTSATGTFATVAAPTISGISAIDTTLSPGSATGISTSSASNVGTTNWTNGSNTSFANLSLVTGSGTLAQQADPTTLTTSGTFAITSSGNASITIRAINQAKTAEVTWAQTNAQSYTINYSIGGLGVQTPVSGNSSASNPSVLLYSNTVARSVTVSSITVYPQQNQQGTGVTLSSPSTITPANKITNTTASNAVTYFSPPSTPSITYSSVTSSSFTVSWSSSGATSYTVQIYESVSGNPVSGYPQTGVTSTSASISTLQPNRGYSTTITAFNSSGSAVFTASTTTSLGAALTPSLGAATGTADGFTFNITNYDAAYTWGKSTTSGTVTFGTPSGSTYPVTVTGLAAGASATVTITTTRTNYNGGTADRAGTANTGAAYNSTFTATTSTADGFTGQITNYSASFTYSIATSAGSVSFTGSPNIANATYNFTVTGLSSGQSATVTVTTTRSGYANGSGTSSGSAIAQVTPTVSTITASTTGRSGTSPNFVFANPKATFNFTFTNTVSCTINLDNSVDGITWTLGVANNLSVSGNAISLSTNLPAGTTSTSGNYYYRARVIGYSQASQSGNSTGIKTSSSVRNTTTPVNNASLSFA
jgi:hypothetical protein